MLPRLLALLLTAGLLSACSSQSCDELGALQAERDEMRTAYTALTDAGTAPPDEVEQAHDALHAFEARVFDVEQECSGR